MLANINALRLDTQLLSDAQIHTVDCAYEESAEGVEGADAESGRNMQECSEPTISHESLRVLGMHDQWRNGENGHAIGDGAGGRTVPPTHS